MLFRSLLAVLLVVGLPGAATSALAQSTAIPPQSGVEVGQATVNGPNWTFSGDLADAGGPWGSVTVTNTNCTTPYRPGTAQAGAVIFTALVSPGSPASGALQAFRGSSASGQVRLLPMADTGGTSVTASLQGLEPFVVGTTLTVCLTLGVSPPMLASIDVGQQRVAATNFDVTGVATSKTDSYQTLIAISGTQTTFDGINRQWVFFFLDSDYLGTDTAVPSLAPLQLVGSPGQAQVDVNYSDPNGGPPDTVTYTWTNGHLDASDIPPGH